MENVSVMMVSFALFVCSVGFLFFFFIICSTSPPGGNQVDGLPPAASVLQTTVFIMPMRCLIQTEQFLIWFSEHIFYK